MNEEERWNSYFYENEDVLINNLNIHDKYLSEYNGNFNMYT